MSERTPLEEAVVAIVADALDRDPAAMALHDSLVDDLGAESIDFIDLVFRVETAFGIKIEGDDLWRGPSQDEGVSIGERVARLRARMPAFRWDRFGGPVTLADLPRLITPRTIVEYLRERGFPDEGVKQPEGVEQPEAAKQPEGVKPEGVKQPEGDKPEGFKQ